MVLLQKYRNFPIVSDDEVDIHNYKYINGNGSDAMQSVNKIRRDGVHTLLYFTISYLLNTGKLFIPLYDFNIHEQFTILSRMFLCCMVAFYDNGIKF